MTFKKSLLTATLLTVAGLTAVSSANAADEGTFDVKVTITSVCNVIAAKGTNDVLFGTVAAGTDFNTLTGGKTSADITVECSKNAPYIVNLQPASSEELTGAGVMTGPEGPDAAPADTIAYQLTKAANGANWGGAGTLEIEGNGVAGIGLGLGTTVASYPVFAKLGSSTDVRPGIYSDTVTVSIIY